MKKLDISELRAAFEYRPETGALVWKLRPSRGVKAGDLAGCFKNKRYGVVKYKNERLRVHRVCWAVHYGEDPPAQIDHINGRKTDNRVNNMRLADTSQNGCNRGKQRNNKSGFKGVSFCKVTGRWLARIQFRKKNEPLGLFDTPEAAHSAYTARSLVLHGEFSNPGSHH